jgi:hypothetical protein
MLQDYEHVRLPIQKVWKQVKVSTQTYGLNITIFLATFFLNFYTHYCFLIYAKAS